MAYINDSELARLMARLDQTRRLHLNALLGRHVAQKYRRLARERGVNQTARNLRKQGYPLVYALLILVGRA